MSAVRHPARWERLETRLRQEQKDLIQRAAELEGRSLTDYVVDSAVAAARQTIQSHQMLQLTARDAETFFAAIDNPPLPNERLRAAAERYQNLIGE